MWNHLHPTHELDSVQNFRKRLVHLLHHMLRCRSCKCLLSHPPLYFRQLESCCSAFLACDLLSPMHSATGEIKVVFKYLPPPLVLQRQTYLLCSLLPLVLIYQMELFQMGVWMRPEESLRNLPYTQAGSVQSKEHPKNLCMFQTKLYNQKAIPSALMKKKGLKERDPPEMNK